ncbi:hypothetical protein Ahy_A03g015135 [Arachis hypogaea]|uniref:Uncharacterized protein n=1 Tax=Arachis hypogaea TaxID=3818 RepID=A0A445DZS6_ARAHY|nr:hypothetical protein Ahy_A03g015135 [Arachis hypogaea]
MPAHKLHTARSISFGEHKRRKEAKLRCHVSFLEVYGDVHKIKSGEYVFEVSKKIIDLYGEAISHKYGENLIDQLKLILTCGQKLQEPTRKEKFMDVSLPEDTDVSIVKPILQVEITEATKESLPSAINAVFLNVVNEPIQNNLLSLLFKIPGFSQENNTNLVHYKKISR